jgi:Family of unknown function (DUF6084)
MPDLNFAVEGAEAVPFAASPLLAFKLRIRQGGEGASVPIHTVALRCQVRIEPARRRYAAPEQERLLDLFGTPDRWGQTVRSMLWTHASIVVPAFTDATLVDLPVPCTYDFNVAGTKYFHALEEGEIPLSLLFSGTIFYEAEDARLQVAQISWEKETSYRLPVQVWKDMMAHYYPNSAWLCLRQDIFERLYAYKRRQGLPTWEEALERLLAAEVKETPAG